MKAIPLTDKAVKAIISALRSAANIRSTAKERQYMAALAKRMTNYQQMCAVELEYTQRFKREMLRRTAKKR